MTFISKPQTMIKRILLANTQSNGKSALCMRLKESFPNLMIIHDLDGCVPHIGNDLICCTNRMDPKLFDQFDIVVVNITPKTEILLRTLLDS